jgi:DNA polymerase elongation subunit (family B)
MSHIIFDIETGSYPVSELVAPEFTAPGNYKDPVKIAENIAGQREAWLKKTALYPTSGIVLTFGFKQGDSYGIMDEFLGCKDEATTIEAFWAMVKRMHDGEKLVGFNSHGFDLPFLIRRSWKLGIPVPGNLMRGRYFNPELSIDLLEMWTCGRKDDSIKLADLAKFLGCGEKSGNGADFQSLWETDRPKAIEYLKNDIELTERIAKKMGVIK